MNVIDELKIINDKLDVIDEYSNTLSDELSKVDCKMQDLLHYIEFNKISVKWCYRMMKEMKELREKKRKIKNDMEILSKYNETKTKLLTSDNRKFLMTEIYKKDKQLNQPYKNREYTEEDMQKILKGV